MNPAHPTRADQMRAAREALDAALDWGCTPAEARARLDHQRARERWQRAMIRLDAKRKGMM